MTSVYNLSVIVTCLVLLRVLKSTAQTVSTPACCSMNIMDATGLVALETGRPLVTTTETMQAVRVRACTNDPFAIQIWRINADGSYQFRWQSEITLLSRADFVIDLAGAPLELTPDDRLGVFAPMSSARMAAAFRLDPAAGVYYSTQRYSDFSGFSASTSTNLDDLKWPRTFNESVSFCREAGCADQPVSTLASTTVSTTTRSSGTTNGLCCPTYPLSCDATDVTNSLNNQTGRVIELQNTISIITKIINDLFGSRQQTGNCPQGFTPGTIGVGKCYLLFREPVQMAIAVLRCRDNFQARLIAIETLNEENFLKILIQNNTQGGIENFWTSGMYNRAQRDWFWFDESSKTRTTQVYRNWPDNFAPIPTTDADVCSTLTVDNNTNDDYWLKQICTTSNFFICEAPKTCL